ncbi:MAG: hypothetical protein ACK4TL_15520 [Hyphomicrobiaceae bacterium]
MAVSRQTSFEIDGRPEDLLEPTVRALADMRCYRFRREGMEVSARTQFSLRSIGEVITVRLSGADDGRTRVDVSSRSVLGTVIFDWGKNSYNLRRFEAAFRARVAQQAKVG